MTHYVYPALHALFIWWFSTGLVIFLDGLPRKTFRYSMIGATLVLVGALYGLEQSAGDDSVGGVYLAFTSGLLAWSWLEISFYLGYVTGVRKQPCEAGCSGWRHFGHAISASIWHELAILMLGAAVVALTWDRPNPVGGWTFLVLWWMHQSAKLNVFLGVRNLNAEFIPDHIGFLKSFFSQKPMNLLFPVSVTVSTVIAVLLFQRSAEAVEPVYSVGYSVVGTMMVLAILEHWFLVLPLPSARLWAWSMRSRPTVRPATIEIVTGFLGAGKTSFMRRQLDLADPAQRTIVLVNDFAAIGVDGSLLDGRGATVVELPNGCICCSLRQDLSTQLREIIGKHAPDRVLIEPSGVADVASLLQSLSAPDVAPMVRECRVIAVVDAASFPRDFAGMTRFFEAQAAVAGTVLVNKADLVSAEQLALVRDTISSLNPAARVITATFGAVPPGALDRDRPEMLPAFVPESAHDHQLQDHHHHHHDEATAGLHGWTRLLGGACTLVDLRQVLDMSADGMFGDIARLKGLVRCGDGWLRFDIAGGRPSITAFAATATEQPRVVAIGRALDLAALELAFTNCIGAGA